MRRVVQSIVDDLNLARPFRPPPVDIHIAADSGDVRVEFLSVAPDALSGVATVELVDRGFNTGHDYDKTSLENFHFTQVSRDRTVDLASALTRSIAIRLLVEVSARQPAPVIKRLSILARTPMLDPSRGTIRASPFLFVTACPEDLEDVSLSSVDPGALLGRLKAREASSYVEGPPLDLHLSSQSATAAPEQELSGLAFEHFIAALLGRMGIEASVTRASRDGGIDLRATDTRPIVGGTMLIQAKRYSSTVGVGAVRDLYGALMSEGAAKALLITTSTFSTDAREFAAGKPLELIDGVTLRAIASEYGL